MTKIKICGLTDTASFEAAIEAGADYAGLVFYPPSPRCVAVEQAASLAQRAAGRIKLVGLFVAPEFAALEAVLKSVPLDILQIYGSSDQADRVKQHFNLPVWRQLGAASVADFPAEDEAVDGFVVEAKPPAGATRPGGNGVLADWALLADFQPRHPWLLAGGLTPDNVGAALARAGAPGVDVSSGVETRPGQKSPALIRRFVEAVRVQEAGPAYFST